MGTPRKMPTERAAQTGIFRTSDVPVALRGKFASDGLVRITVEAVDENGLTQAEQDELSNALAEAAQGVGLSPAFQDVREAVTFLRKTPQDMP